MWHSTGHPTRLAREFGRMDLFGTPDEKYCMEELQIERQKNDKQAQKIQEMAGTIEHLRMEKTKLMKRLNDHY